MRPLYSFSLVDRGTKLITKGSIRCDIKIVGPQTKLSAPYKKNCQKHTPTKIFHSAKNFVTTTKMWKSKIFLKHFWDENSISTWDNFSCSDPVVVSKKFFRNKTLSVVIWLGGLVCGRRSEGLLTLCHAVSISVFVNKYLY